MKEIDNKKALIEAALMATITSLFVIGTFYIPFLGILLTVLPVPFIIISVRHGTKYTLLSLIIVSLIIGFITGILYTGFVFVIFAPIALAMGYAIKNRKKPYEVIGFGTAASMFSSFFLLQVLAVATGTNIVDEIANAVRGAMEHQAEMLTAMELSVADINETINYAMMIIPGLIVIQSMIGAFTNYYLTSKAINRFKFIDYQLGEFSDFKLPGNIIIGSFIIFVLSLMTKYIEGIQHISLITNVFIIFISIFFLQGITFISYLLKKSKVPTFIRVILVVLLVLISPLITVVAIMGLIDAVFDVRRFKEKR